MGANFTPTLKGYTEPSTFRFWCQKVLPTVYDDSLSFYELLGKIVEYLNSLIEALERGELADLIRPSSAYTENVIYKTTLFDKPTMYRKKVFTRLTANDHVYGQQGCIVTDKYVVLAMNDLTSVDSSNLIYVLDRDTYEPVDTLASNPILLNFSASTTPTSSHANSMAWNKDAGEIYLFTQKNKYVIAFDDTTLVEKRRFLIPVNGQIGYDNKNKLWCFISYEDAETYAIQVYDETITKLLKTVTGKRIGTTQGCFFNNGVIFLPTSLSSDDTTLNDLQCIQVVDIFSNNIKTWWFKGFEIEDIGEKDENTLVVATNSGTNVKVFELPIRGENITSELEHYDLLEMCNVVDMDYVANKVSVSGDNQWSYFLNENTKFIVAFGRFYVTPTSYTQNNAVAAQYYSDILNVDTPFEMANYKFSCFLGRRNIAVNPSHNANYLGFRMLSASDSLQETDANIVLVGYIK